MQIIFSNDSNYNRTMQQINFKDVAHLYLKPKSIISYKGMVCNIDWIQFTTKNIDEVVINVRVIQSSWTLDEKDYKPILRLLFNISEEEAIEIGLYKQKKECHELSWEQVQQRLVKACNSNIEIEFTPLEMMKLINQNFDLFGLINSGQAIDLETV